MEDDYTSQFNTQLDDRETEDFSQWSERQKQLSDRDPAKDMYNYDMQGWWLDHQGEDLGEGHLTDTYKKPNHPTFSDESMYNGVDGHEGGHWTQNADGSFTFTAGLTNFEQHGAQGLRDYFSKVEKGNTLDLSQFTDQVNPYGPEGIQDIVTITAKMAPDGLDTESMRPSTNVEDNRRYVETIDGDVPIRTGFKLPEAKTEYDIDEDVAKAQEQSTHDLDRSPMMTLLNFLKGHEKYDEEAGRDLPDDFVALRQGVDKYVKSGGPQKDIDAYHNSPEGKEADDELRLKQLSEQATNTLKNAFEKEMRKLKHGK